MKPLGLLCGLCAMLCIPALALAADAPALRGFSLPGSARERTLEERFRANVSADSVREFMRRLSARPHHVGSAYDRDNAEWMAAKLRAWGWESRLDSYQVLFPTPRVRLLEMTAPKPFRAALEEPAMLEDPTSSQKEEQLPTYNCYSADGDVTAPLVYVNYGMPDDYEQLERLGVSVKGAVVIARYGNGWRGLKPKLAHEHGAVGCLIYSDPKDDGFTRGAAYPVGPWRPGAGVQRGSVADMPTGPGDVLTPGEPAHFNARRLSIQESPKIMKIPVQPIGWEDARPLLAELGGVVAPEAWRGALPLTYRVGPGPATVHLKLTFDWSLKPIYNVVAQIPGAQADQEWVIRGNHHDAWVNGARDPISGAACVLEEARCMGILRKSGWKPRRTVMVCLWDGEEPGLLGSTEFTEDYAKELSEKAVLYLNSDSNGRGFLQAGGSHILESLVNESAAEVQDPETRLGVQAREFHHQLQQATEAELRTELRKAGQFRLGALGSGSDYTAFLDHLGIPSLDLGFGGEGGGGEYHSIYDSFSMYMRFGDSTLAYGRALAQTAGTVMLRVANAAVLPYDFTSQAATIRRYLQEVQKLHKTRQDEAREVNQKLEEGTILAMMDPRAPTVAPAARPVAPDQDFSGLEAAVAGLEEAAKQYALAAEGVARSKDPIENAGVEELNSLLRTTERKLLDSRGLPGRPWFQHLLYAPGLFTGYGVKTIPGVRESIEQADWKELPLQLTRLVAVLHEETTLVRAATAELRRLVP